MGGRRQRSRVSGDRGRGTDAEPGCLSADLRAVRVATDVRGSARVTSISDLFDEDEYGRALLETLSPTLRRTLRSALASQTEAEFFVSHELRYRVRRPEERARVVETLRLDAHGRRRLVRRTDGGERTRQP